MKHFFLLCFLLPLYLTAQNATVNRSLEPFDKIDIAGGFDAVLLKAGDSESISIDVQGIDPEKILTYVKNGRLRITTKNSHPNRHKIRVTVTYRSLTAIANSGSANIETLTAIRGGELKIATSGSGNFKGELDVQSLLIAISGSSNMTLRGNAEIQEIAISGSGDVDATALNGSTAEVAISGAGNVKLAVSGKVKSSISGSGKVVNK